MIDMTRVNIGEILDRVRRLSCPELGPTYIAAAVMVEAGADPREVVEYIEERYLRKE